MTGWQFAASVISSLAWPVAVVVLAIVFRAQLRRLVSGDVRRWKAGPSGVEVEFSEPLDVHLALTKQVLEQATSGLDSRIADLERQVADRVGDSSKQPEPNRNELQQLRRKLQVSSAALEALENTLDHMAALPPGVRGTVTWAAVAGRRPTVTFDVVRPKPSGEDPQLDGGA